MTVKEFFKGKAFKCILVLLCVLLVSGVLLSICWGFLEVTDEERFGRKIGKVYGGETVTATEQDLSGSNTKINDATIDKVWYVEEKNDYLVQVYSKGYGGNITCWVALSMDESKKNVSGVRKVILYQVADPAELTGNIGGEVYDKFTQDYTDGKEFSYGDKSSSEFIGTGASHSLTAICNCVNGSVTFIKAFASGEVIVDPFEGLTDTTLISKSKTTWSVEGTSVKYQITTTSNEGPSAFKINITVDATKKITAYEITHNGCEEDGDKSAEDYKNDMAPQALDLTGATLDDVNAYLNNDPAGSLSTGATRSNELCYHAAKFALANYDAILAKEAAENE